MQRRAGQRLCSRKTGVGGHSFLLPFEFAEA